MGVPIPVVAMSIAVKCSARLMYSEYNTVVVGGVGAGEVGLGPGMGMGMGLSMGILG